MLICAISALGTPLEWPEAKQNAQLVREWGIQVRLRAANMLVDYAHNIRYSNY